MGINFDDIEVRLTSLTHQPHVEFTGSTERKVKLALNTIYTTVAASGKKNPIEKRRLLEKAETIVKQFENAGVSIEGMVERCREYLGTEKQEVESVIEAEEKARSDALVADFKKGVGSFVEEKERLKGTPNEPSSFTILRVLGDLFSTLSKTQIKLLEANQGS